MLFRACLVLWRRPRKSRSRRRAVKRASGSKKAEQRTLNAERETLALQSAKDEVIASSAMRWRSNPSTKNLYDWDIDNDTVYYAPGLIGFSASRRSR